MGILKENTFRALKDQPLLATHQWQCAFGIHTWQKWSDPIKTRRGVYDYVEQYRVCGHCGKAAIRILSKN